MNAKSSGATGARKPFSIVQTIYVDMYYMGYVVIVLEYGFVALGAAALSAFMLLWPSLPDATRLWSLYFVGVALNMIAATWVALKLAARKREENAPDKRNMLSNTLMLCAYFLIPFALPIAVFFEKRRSA